MARKKVCLMSKLEAVMEKKLAKLNFGTSAYVGVPTTTHLIVIVLTL